MLQKSIKFFAVILIVMIAMTGTLSAKSEMKKETRFQIGFGLIVNTSNLLGLIESVKMYNAMVNGATYNYPGLTQEQQDAMNKINGAMQRALLVANILGGMEYGLQMRILWQIMMIETDLTVLPLDGSYNGRLDMVLSVMGGIKAPFFIMPYLLAGVDFTFSFYPNQFASLENWKDRWAATDNFAFRPGLNIKAGLDLKFPNFSIGGYYQYTIKDFQEFTLWYEKLKEANISASDAAGMIFGAQSRFGIAVSLYIP